MSTTEDRAHDAERDARTACPECAAEGFATSVADCPGHDAEARTSIAASQDPTQQTCPDGPGASATHHLRPTARGKMRCEYCGRTRAELVQAEALHRATRDIGRALSMFAVEVGRRLCEVAAALRR